MAGRSKGFKKRLPVGVTEEEDDLIERKIEEGLAESANEVIRHYFKKGVAGILPVPSTHFRELPVLAEVPCGTACDLDAVLKSDDLERRIIRDPDVLALATENAFIGKANGWSMRDGQLPNSISDGDELLMVPFYEWETGLRPGLIILVHLHMTDGTDQCILKEWDGKVLKANNPTFKKVDYFGEGVESAIALAVCVARLPKVFR